MHVIGTAGHVDHGKSALVQALTGINPDRLQEEQDRHLTIDLGFAWLTLPNGESVGIVDVPGHEDFIENMLAGVGGIDVAVLVIAADEGVMPQTQEHFHILQLLEIPQLIVALSKIDMIDDPDWLELVLLDVHELLEGSAYADAAIVQVSAHQGFGLDHLLEILMAHLQKVQRPTLSAKARLPIDRVFTLSGFGTVVTGTLLDAPLQVGDVVEVQPSNKQGRIRGLQSHNESIEVAEPGSRTAVNISGIDHHEIQRGDVLSVPGFVQPTLLVDVLLHYLPDASHPLKHNAEVKVFCGTSEVIAQVRLLSDDMLLPGTTGYAQLQLRDALPAIRQQRFIIRRPSPAHTIGGGVILDTAPGRKWRRQRKEVLARFERLARGTLEDFLAESLIQAKQALSIEALSQRLGREPLVIADVLTQSSDFIVQDELVLHVETANALAGRLFRKLEHYHQEYPLRPGIDRLTLQKRSGLDEATMSLLLDLLETAQDLVQQQGLWRLPDFEPSFSRAQQQALAAIYAALEQDPQKPPSVKDLLEMGGAEILDALIMRRDLIQLNAEVVLAYDVYETWVAYARESLLSDRALTVAILRDRFETSRKYALAFLEFLDSYQVTRRSGDVHILGRGSWERLPSR